MEIILALLAFVALVWWRAAARRRDMAEPPLLDDEWRMHYIPREADMRPREADGRFRAGGASPKPARRQRPRFEISYCNRDGEVSRRTIRVHEIEYVDEVRRCTYLSAFCDLRGDQLTFRADRILSMVDLQTGETVADPAAHLMIYAGPIIKARSTGDSSTARATKS
jgi:hypothetical protein